MRRSEMFSYADLASEWPLDAAGRASLGGARADGRWRAVGGPGAGAPCRHALLHPVAPEVGADETARAVRRARARTEGPAHPVDVLRADAADLARRRAVTVRAAAQTVSVMADATAARDVAAEAERGARRVVVAACVDPHAVERALLSARVADEAVGADRADPAADPPVHARARVARETFWAVTRVAAAAGASAN